MSEGGEIVLRTPVVVRSPNWLGDVVMALPAVRNLKAKLGKEPLAVAAPAKVAAVWKACAFVDKVVELAAPRRLFKVAAALRQGEFESLVLLPNSLRSAMEGLLAGIPQIIGYRGHSRGLLLSHAIDRAGFDFQRQHQQYDYLDLMAAVGAPEDLSFPVLQRPGGASAVQDRIAVFPGAAYGPAKRWLAVDFATVARRLQEKRGAEIIILGAPGDRETAQHVADGVPGAVNRAGETTLEEMMTVLAASRVVLCNDSGAMHLASAMGRPTVAVFGSTEPRRTGPLGPGALVLREHVACSPCFLRECPLDLRCMTSVTPETVVEACLRAWGQARP